MPSPEELSLKMRQWAQLRAQTDLISSRMNRLRDDLMEAALAGGDQDERGNIHLPLPAPITVGDKTYSAIKREARKSTTLNEERALALAHELGLQNELITHEPRIDVDKLYAAWQRGRITEEQIDGLYDDKVTYAFKPVAS